jgi:soluble lytic murein transglycosylase-like protein
MARPDRLPATAPEIEQYIANAASTYNVPVWVVRGVILRESGGNPDAPDGDGGRARGIAQMHEPAARQVGFDWSKLKDPALAIQACAAYLAWIREYIGCNWFWAMAAYNQGPVVIRKAYDYACDAQAKGGGTPEQGEV